MFLGCLGTRASCKYIVKGLVAAHSGINAGWTHGIDINIVRCQFNRQRFDQSKYAMFGCDIVRQVCHPLHASSGCDTDNLATSPGEHAGNANLASDPYPLEVDVDCLIPLLFAQLPTGSKRVEASIRYHNINWSQCAFCLL